MAIAVAVALAIEVVFVVVTLLGRPPRGPASSSYAAGHEGARAYARLLERGGHEVRRQRVPVDVERPDPSDTVVVLDGDRPDADEVAAMAGFLQAGGRLVVAGGPTTDAWVAPLVGTLQRGAPLLACQPLASVPETAGVRYVESSGQLGWGYTGSALPVLGCNGSTLAAVAAVGKGRLVLVSDAAVFRNYLLSARDNAAFAVAAAGGVRRDVVFLEHLHGFRSASGLAALPGPWLLAVAMVLLAGLLAVVARRRLGADRAPAGAAEQPRSAHAEAVSQRLAGSPKPEAARLVRSRARRAVAAAAGLPPDSPVDELQAAALRLGLPADDVRRAIGDGPDDDGATVAGGRILAACHGLRRPRT